MYGSTAPIKTPRYRKAAKIADLTAGRAESETVQCADNLQAEKKRKIMAIFKAVILMLVLGGLIGIFLGIAGQKLYVKPDTRVEDVLAMLPGYNCGGCGNPGCAGMAAKLVEGAMTVDKCRPCKPEAREKIKAYLAEHQEA